MELPGSATDDNLREALAREAAVGHRLQWFAELADVEGQPEMAAAFRSIAESSKGNVFGVLEFLADDGGEAAGNAGVARDEQQASSSMYADFASTALSEGHEDVADWFERMANAAGRSAARVEKATESNT